MINADQLQTADLLIVGASTRAAAFSAIRAGFRPFCLDQFADSDLQQHVPVRRIANYPEGLIPILESLPALPLVYTGGLENRTDVLTVAKKHQQLWGNDSAAVNRVRDPHQLGDAARLARVQIPESRHDEDHPPQDGSWLLRPRLSAGGRGISLWTPEASNSPVLDEPHFFQQRIGGISYSAAFIGSPQQGDVRFVGVTRQLVGEAACHAGKYQWCGNIGPTALSVNVENLIRRLGNVLKWKLGLVGLYGVDFLVDEAGTPWITEVNPRYPASLELLEHATGLPLLADHAACFDADDLPQSSWRLAHPGEFMGKAILYSPVDFTLQAPLADPASVSALRFPDIADIPAVGERISKGDPICTVYAESTSPDETWSLLQERLQELSEKVFAQG